MYPKHLRSVYKVETTVFWKNQKIGGLKGLKPKNLIFAIQGGQDGELNSSEDCLFVQITTRKWLMMNRETDKKPYVQYIHGGAFNFGSGSDQGPTFLVIIYDIIIDFLLFLSRSIEINSEFH